MADAIIKFPSPIKENMKATEDSSIFQKIEETAVRAMPDNTASVYPAILMYNVPMNIKSVPDLETGGNRNPRWGMMVSFSIVPELHKQPMGPVVLHVTPTQFLASDTLEDLRDRVMFELDKAIELARIAEKHPDEYAAYEQALMKRANESE